MSDPSPEKAWEYDEPWDTEWRKEENNWVVKDSTGHYILRGYGELGIRAAECVNALKGCPNPQAFVDAVKDALKDDIAYVMSTHPAFAWLREDSSSG